MIKYTLKCDNGHRFDSWFASSEAYDSLTAAGRVACIDCGSAAVEKSLMAPNVSTDKDLPTLTAKPDPKEQALAKMRDHVENNADYVGMSFAKEARDIHDGTAPERAIYGEANLKEAKALIDDGVPVAPLPFLPKRKAN